MLKFFFALGSLLIQLFAFYLLLLVIGDKKGEVKEKHEHKPAHGH